MHNPETIVERIRLLNVLRPWWHVASARMPPRPAGSGLPLAPLPSREPHVVPHLGLHFDCFAQGQAPLRAVGCQSCPRGGEAPFNTASPGLLTYN